MFAERFRRRRPDRVGRLLATSAIEALESRQLMAYTPLGSQPRLLVTAQTGAIASYGGPLTVTLDVQNVGASSVVEPLNLAPGSISTADAPASTVGVFLLRNPHVRPGGKGSVRVGTIEVPSVEQNSLLRVTDTLTLPGRPRRFPGNGGAVFVGFRTDGNIGSRRLNRINNVSPPVPVQVTAALPDLAAIAIDLPENIQPGDSIAPALKIANYGAVNSNTQAPVTVLLVASTDRQYGPTDLILARYVIDSLPGLSEAPSKRVVLGDVNLDDPPNVSTLTTQADGNQVTTLPSGSGYFIGVVVDPLNEIRELREVAGGVNSDLQLVRQVGNIPDLPPAGILSDPAPASNLFPTPPFAPVATVGLPDFLFSASAFDFSTFSQTTGGTVTAASVRNREAKKASF